MKKQFRPAIGPFAFAAALAATSPAWAFCRVTDCVFGDGEACVIDEEGCLIDGIPLGWMPGADVTFAADSDTAAESGMDEDEAAQAVEQAALAWATAFCADDAVPSIVMRAVDETDGEAKVLVLFRSDYWPYEERAVARTSLTFDLDSGVISGATVEVNTYAYVLARTPEEGEVDLVAVLAHEFGHVMGLDHTMIEGATMEAESESGWADGLRTLEQDDVDGLCSLYPPQASEPESYDVSDDVEMDQPSSGCSTSARHHPPYVPAPSAFAGLLLGGAFVLAVRRRLARG